MDIEKLGPLTLAFLPSEGPLQGSEADAVDIIGNTYGTGAEMVVVPVGRLVPEFLQLDTRVAGLFFQKMQNYSLRLAVIGDISERMAASKALRDFVGETNRIGHHLFVPDRAALVAALERGR
ncbi:MULTISPECIES: DUF4180 domain-containing protein [Devosia]|uniref:DUF4180 domain-containing protein n=1 Tax=Devosia equisanguinis TaxID=2490941 RepID=A0A3S4D494_9HYPH|nr:MULTISPECIES: DUF4180 domain-containing protein [Devosia]ODT48399.1 MAG: hypothetical protein ABS74_14795 [Pelagibacterium sp. SCN 63-126]ODU86157.1 MAG: hypothetical protein ABT14_10230 [Pelagibacterium sp. SCN 63-17]OJX43660.1 MAG: hypothetical protein BGO80_15070 [Devosia sp. 63-57]VDS04058.1 hypothetical protein DEVEQU_01189 [Devosia equisanguinis]